MSAATSREIHLRAGVDDGIISLEPLLHTIYGVHNRAIKSDESTLISMQAPYLKVETGRGCH